MPRPFWLDSLPARETLPPLTGVQSADLCIVGGGFTGLWAALYAQELVPTREVVVLEAARSTRAAAFRRRRPLPFRPEPLRSAVIQLTRDRLAAADCDGGRRGVWLPTLDRLGLGFDS